MRLGLYNAILHDRPLTDAIEVIAGLGLTGIEINTGGFLPPVHVPNIDEILTSDTARDDFLGVFEDTWVSIAGLNCNGNPLHPHPAIGPRHAADVHRSIRLAQRLGQHRVVTMSGLPAGERGGTRPNWIVNAWNSAALDVLDHQWQLAADFWRETDRLACDCDVKVALELDRVPAGTLRGGPGDAGQHRARGRRVGADRGDRRRNDQHGSHPRAG